jgi:hypothetical protein
MSGVRARKQHLESLLERNMPVLHWGSIDPEKCGVASFGPSGVDRFSFSEILAITDIGAVHPGKSVVWVDNPPRGVVVATSSIAEQFKPLCVASEISPANHHEA